MTDLATRLEAVLALVGIDPAAAAVEIAGADPVLATRYRVGEAGAVAIAASAVAAADLWRLRGGAPQRIEVPVLAATAAMRSNHYLKIDGAAPPRPRDPVTGFYEVKDGRWVYLHCNFPNLRDANLSALGVAPDPEKIAEAARGWDGAALEDALFAAGGCGALVRSEAEWRALPQAQAVAAEPLIELIRIGDAPPEPLPGGDRPLSGVRALDLTRVLAGPTCGRTLAEHGADVLKIAREDLPDSGMFDLDTGIGKLSAFLDFRTAAGTKTLRDLVRGADIFSQSYRPGALEARGFGPEALAAIRPGIIYVTLDAWGFSGPWRDRRGYDTVVQGPNGMAFTGEGQKPQFLPVSVQDYVAGYLMAMGAMAALKRRDTEGGSWLVRTSLAGAGHFTRDFGLVPQEAYARCGRDIPAEALPALLMDSPSPAGRLTHLAPTARMSATPGRWERPAVALGTHEPVWPERVPA